MKKNLILLTVVLFAYSLWSQEEKKYLFVMYGQVMTDVGYNTGQVNPDFFDVMRPTQLPSFENEYGLDGNFAFSVRQSRMGFRSYFDTKFGQLETRFEFDLFGVGSNVGQTAFHMLYAYVELGMVGAGHHWSLFSDVDGFPNTLEYWGPSGLSLCKNVQIRFMPLKGETRLSFALENPGGSRDEGIYTDRIELDDVKARFRLPDFTAECRVTKDWGYVELAGVIRRIQWEDLGNDQYDLTGSATGWGVNLSTNLIFGEKNIFRGQAVHGEGIQNLMNDATTDIGIQNNFDNPVSPVKGVALPITGFSAYLDRKWNDDFTSSIGYSTVIIENSDAQAPSAYHKGHYASVNLLYYPIKNVTAGMELIWIDRENNEDGWTDSSTKIQISLRYSFLHSF
ncbi:MAG: DcaP family trimeric outer membrane transporter [Flavobacteriaceae bacterium]|nr:DcaP family trimeric outer membrane transporter [Flavobacteriaceae bacterium]